PSRGDCGRNVSETCAAAAFGLTMRRELTKASPLMPVALATARTYWRVAGESAWRAEAAGRKPRTAERTRRFTRTSGAILRFDRSDSRKVCASVAEFPSGSPRGLHRASRARGETSEGR